MYGDDILLIENDIPMLTMIKRWLSKKFSMKDLGEASYILGIKVYRDRSKRMLGLSQKLYIEKMLKKFNIENSKRGLLSLSHSIHLSKTMCLTISEKVQRMSRIPYASTIKASCIPCCVLDLILSLLWVSQACINQIQVRSTG